MTHNTIRFPRWLLITVILLSACSLGRAEVAPPTSTALILMTQSSLVPPSTRDLQTAPNRNPEPTAEVLDEACTRSAGQATARNVINAQVDYDGKQIEVHHTIHYVNRTNDSFSEIVFDVEPNRMPGAFVLHTVTASQPLDVVEMVGRRLTLDLTGTLAPGCPIDIALEYTVSPPHIATGISGLTGYFGHTNRQLNLGHWLPSLAVYRDGAWITHDVTVIGEQTVVDVADWDVTLTVSNAPPTLIVAAPGIESRPRDDQWHFELNGRREFAVSFSPFFRVASAYSDQGVEVQIYTFDDAVVDTPAGRVDGALQALEAAVQSLSMYSDLFGNYRDNRYIVVQGDFPDGMEFSDLVFVGDQWFRTNPGSPQSYLTALTAHETAHQWWYARVGNDQAVEPWLDEAFATYSEYLFYEEFHPDLKDWWWNFRIFSFVPANFSGRHVDSTVYEFATVRDYINAVYLRGAEMLDAFRGELGTDAFFDWLNRYSEIGTDRVVSANALWALLTPEQLEAIRLTREEFLNAHD